MVKALFRGALGVAAEHFEGAGYTVVAVTSFHKSDMTGAAILPNLDSALGRMPSETDISTVGAKLMWHTFTLGEARMIEREVAAQFVDYGSECDTCIEERGDGSDE